MEGRVGVNWEDQLVSNMGVYCVLMKDMLNPLPWYLWMLPFLEIGSLQMCSLRYKLRCKLKWGHTAVGVFIRKETQRMPCGDKDTCRTLTRSRDQSTSAASQEMPWVASKPPDARKRPGRILPYRFQRAWPFQHHDLGLLASRTMRQYSSVVLSLAAIGTFQKCQSQETHTHSEQEWSRIGMMALGPSKQWVRGQGRIVLRQGFLFHYLFFFFSLSLTYLFILFLLEYYICIVLYSLLDIQLQCYLCHNCFRCPHTH